MKIALMNTLSPFIRGGAEILVDDLRDQLCSRGHQVTLFRLPFATRYDAPLLGLTAAAKLLDFTAYHRVIAFKFPAYCVCHPHKTLWMFHQFRQVYDLYGAEDGIAVTPENEALKELITSLDCREIGGTENRFVITPEVSRRLQHYNGLTAGEILPPLLNAEKYHAGSTGDYFYYPSRITTLKRQHLAIEALHYTKSGVTLRLAGVCPDPVYDARLKALIAKYHLEDRVIYENRWITEEQKIEETANCLAVVYVPYLEDSSGYASYEAFYSSKPVLTCTDSGGTKDFITEGVTGSFAESTPQALAEKMDAFYQDREKTEEMGRNARAYIEKRNITWDETIRRLLS